MVLRAKTDKRSVGAAGRRSRRRVRPQEECRYPTQLARPPARNNRDLRSDGPETYYKLLCLRAVRGNLLATSSAGPSLRRDSSRKKPLYRSFALSLLTPCLAAPLRVLRFGYLGEAYLLRKVSSIGQVAKNEEDEQAYSWLWVCSCMIAAEGERLLRSISATAGAKRRGGCRQ